MLTPEKKLNKHLNKSGPCWNWTASCHLDGYGQIGIDGKCLYPHRVAYEIWKGPIPPGICVCHTCDNRLCCNPAHLWLGTKADNNWDCIKKGRRGKVGRKKGTGKGRKQCQKDYYARRKAVLQQRYGEEWWRHTNDKKVLTEN